MLVEDRSAGVRRAVLSGGPKNSAPSDRKPGQGGNVSHAGTASMREIASLAQAAYCPGQRALGASDSFGPAGNPARRPPEEVVGNGGCLEVPSSVALQQVETFGWGGQGVEF